MLYDVHFSTRLSFPFNRSAQEIFVTIQPYAEKKCDDIILPFQGVKTRISLPAGKL